MCLVQWNDSFETVSCDGICNNFAKQLIFGEESNEEFGVQFVCPVVHMFIMMQSLRFAELCT